MYLKRKIKAEINYVRDQLWYILTIAFLAFLSGGMLLYEFYVPSANKYLIIFFQELDLAIAYIFLVDFFTGMYASRTSNLKYLRINFLDFLGSVPFSDGFFRSLRILRFTRLVRFLRAANTGLNIKGSIRDLRHKKKMAQKKALKAIREMK